MEVNEAKEFIKKFKDAISCIEQEANQNKYNIDSKNKVLEENKKLKEELSQLKISKKHYDILARSSNVSICPQCDGDGGFYFDMGEQGGQGEECGQCLSSGVVSKLTTRL